MAQYEADKILYLLQLCCWKARCTMDQRGLQQLTEKIDSSTKQETTPGSRYYPDLHSDANIAMKKDNFIGRKSEFIDLLLEFVCINDWQHWQTHLEAASEYIQGADLDLATTSKTEPGIYFPDFIAPKIYPYLTFVKKDATYALKLLECEEKEIEAQLNFVKTQLNEFPYIICAIPISWKDQLFSLKDPSWEELAASRRIVPIWMGESSVWENIPVFVPQLTNRQTISGMSGLLAALMYVHHSMQKYLRPRQETSQEAPTSSRIQNFQNSRGTFLLGDVSIKSKNTALGDIHQNIHQHKNKKP